MATDSITHSIDAPEKALGMDHDPDPEIPAKARRRQFSAR
jgi:transposase